MKSSHIASNNNKDFHLSSTSSSLGRPWCLGRTYSNALGSTHSSSFEVNHGGIISEELMTPLALYSWEIWKSGCILVEDGSCSLLET